MYLEIVFDSNLKVVTKKEFKAFIRFFLPDLYDKIDFDIEPVFVEKELEKLEIGKTKEGTTTGDLVCFVHLKSGEEHNIVVHVEFHGRDNKEFSEDMFVRFYRLFDEHHPANKITVFTLFVTDRIPPNCDTFTYECGDTSVIFKYPFYKVKDCNVDELFKSDNPFAFVVLALKYIIDSRKDKTNVYEKRLELKEKLISFILDNQKLLKFDQDTLINILDFVIKIMLLKPEQDKKLENKLFKKYTEMTEERNEVQLSFYNAFTKAIFGKSVSDLEKTVKSTERKWKLSEQKRKQEEQKRKQEEQKRKNEEQKRKQEEQKRKQEEQKRKQEEQKRKNEEQKRKNEEQKRKQEEQKRKQEEQKKIDIIINLHIEKGMSVKDIADVFDEDEKYIKKVIEQAKKN